MMTNLLIIVLLMLVIVLYFDMQISKETDKTIECENNARSKPDNLIEDEKVKKISRSKELREILDKDWNKLDSEIVYKKFKNRCFNCKTNKNLEIDHHIPLSLGYGLKNKDGTSNAVILCKRCNRRKKDRLPADFYTKEQQLELSQKYKIDSKLSIKKQKIKNLKNFLISEKIKIIKGAIKNKEKIQCDYIEVDSLMNFDKETLCIKPIELRIEKEFTKDSSKKVYKVIAKLCDKNIKISLDIKYMINLIIIVKNN